MIIGITGKSGSGKTFIAKQISQKTNIPILDIDEISHKTLSLDKTKKFIKNAFGDDFFDKNGNVLRKKLGECIFNDKEKLSTLNNFCQTEMEKIIDKELKQNKNIILEYALLTGLKQFKKCDVKILVVADIDVRKKRIIERDNISDDYFDLRENSSYNYYEKDFDLIIENNDNFNIKETLNLLSKFK